MGDPSLICGAWPASVGSPCLMLVGHSGVASMLSRAVALSIGLKKEINESSDSAPLGFARVVMNCGGILDEGNRVIIDKAQS